MKVKYKKERTIITLTTVEERHNIFKALRSYECQHNPGFIAAPKSLNYSWKIVSGLLDEWMKEAGTLKN